MSHPQGSRPSFQFTHDADASDRLVAGFSSFGLAGVTAANYLVDRLDLAETGHVTTEALPSITPFEDGVPRHHTRLFSRPSSDLSVLVNELFVPLPAADPFSESVLDWAARNGVSEITVLAGVPVEHGPDDHRTFYVATEDYREACLADEPLPPMGSGFLDGVNAGLVGQGMESDLRVGVLLTPVHEQVPDVEASIRLLDAAEAVLGVDVDTGALEAFAAEVRQYYRELAERFERAEEAHRPEDRMYV
ncbi:MAG: proteasome assembly chaperone family protein [Haloferacaceae archaeon]